MQILSHRYLQPVRYCLSMLTAHWTHRGSIREMRNKSKRNTVEVHKKYSWAMQILSQHYLQLAAPPLHCCFSKLTAPIAQGLDPLRKYSSMVVPQIPSYFSIFGGKMC